MNATVESDWLVAEQLIIDRVADQVQEFVKVLGAADLSALDEKTPTSPSCFVVYDGDRIPGNTPGTVINQGANQIVFQRWIVIVAVKSAKDVRGGSGARRKAGEIIRATLNALSGWKPEAALGALVRVQAPRPEYAGGFGFFPIAFECRVSQ
jgi:hypothetical protein